MKHAMAERYGIGLFRLLEKKDGLNYLGANQRNPPMTTKETAPDAVIEKMADIVVKLRDPAYLGSPMNVAKAAYAIAREDVSEIVKDMVIAHNMSHTEFCDSGYWRDEFIAKASKLISQPPKQQTEE